MAHLWSGRFEKEPDAALVEFGASFGFDRRLFEDDVRGSVAWTKALDEKTITPKPGITDDVKEDDPNDMEVELTSSGQAEYKVVFPHLAHTKWMACPLCHTGLFEMEKGKAKMTMEKMGAGEQCGACHGKVASPDLTACPVCHQAMGKS
jgi:c(7)-type cytochrome triheme protein